jgi:hypothetical protein
MRDGVERAHARLQLALPNACLGRFHHGHRGLRRVGAAPEHRKRVPAICLTILWAVSCRHDGHTITQHLTAVPLTLAAAATVWIARWYSQAA